MDKYAKLGCYVFELGGCHSRFDICGCNIVMIALSKKKKSEALAIKKPNVKAVIYGFYWR